MMKKLNIRLIAFGLGVILTGLYVGGGMFDLPILVVVLIGKATIFAYGAVAGYLFLKDKRALIWLILPGAIWLICEFVILAK